MRPRAVVPLLALLCLFLSACRSSGVPRYSTRVEPLSEHTFVIRLETAQRFADAEFIAALLTEAARATIDRGALSLRIEALSTNASTALTPTNDVIGVPPRVPDVGNPDISDPERNDPTAGASINVERIRTGEVRFTVGRDLSGQNVFDAAALLERVRRGDVSPLKF
ncbi:MAG: hypothetical protein ACYC7A_08880 [Thermoanaerobaculia bacterium]